MDKRGELYAALRDALEAQGAQQAVAEHVARIQADAVLSRGALLSRVDAQAAGPVPRESLDWAVSRQATADAAEWVKVAERRWAAEGLAADHGPLADYASIAPVAAQGAWLIALQVLAELAGGGLTPTCYDVLFGGSPGFLASPPLAVGEQGGVRLYFWAGLAELGNATGVFPDAEGDKVARLLATLDDVLLPLGILARLQWRIAEQVGILLGMDRAGLAWYPHAQEHVGSAPDRFRKMLDGERLRDARADAESMLVEAPGRELRLAARALRHITDGERFSVPAMQTARLLQGDAVRGFRLCVNHALVSERAIQDSVRELLQAMGRGQERPLSADDDTFLEAVRGAGLEPGQRAPWGFWDTFAESWNQGREQPEAVNALRVRWHRLCKKLANS